MRTRMKPRNVAWAIASATIAALSAQAIQTEGSLQKAKALLESLPESKKQRLVLPFNSEARLSWAYTPGRRPGLAFRELEAAEQKAALELLRSALSEAGYEKAEAIRTKVEPALREIENNPGRDLGLYYYTFFGLPSETGKWGWRYEGHHLSLSFTYFDGKIVSTTPQFLGSNPADVSDGPSKGTRVLAKEEDLGRELVQSLSESQKKLAILSATAPADLLTSNLRKASIQEDKGIAYADLTDDQKLLLKSLVETYAAIQQPEQEMKRLEKIAKSGWAKLKFAWMGGLEKGQGHYYRIQGPTFLIEYDNTQNRANHIHTVWRDFNGDFGADVIGQHYRTAEHHRYKQQPATRG